jgi:hypothetical protein
MPEPKHAAEQEMEARLREAFSRDPESSFLGILARLLCDPAKARDANDRPRFHPLFLILALAGLTAIAAFLYFSFSQS